MQIIAIVCVEGHKKELEHIAAYERNFLLMHFNVFRLHLEINLHF